MDSLHMGNGAGAGGFNSCDTLTSAMSAPNRLDEDCLSIQIPVPGCRQDAGIARQALLHHDDAAGGGQVDRPAQSDMVPDHLPPFQRPVLGLRMDLNL
jgi:hypothetical protein